MKDCCDIDCFVPKYLELSTEILGGALTIDFWEYSIYSNNLVLGVQTRGCPYIVKVFRPGNTLGYIHRFKNELQAVRLLESHNILQNYLVGNQYNAPPMGSILIFRRIVGSKLDNLDRSPLDFERALIYLKQFVQITSSCPGFIHEKEDQSWFEFSIRELYKSIQNIENRHNLHMRNTTNRILGLLEDISKEVKETRYYFCHGDLSRSNIFSLKGHYDVQFIDFENSRFDFRELDIASLLLDSNFCYLEVNDFSSYLRIHEVPFDHKKMVLSMAKLLLRSSITVSEDLLEKHLERILKFLELSMN